MSHDPSEIILICWFGAQDTFLIIMLLQRLKCLIIMLLQCLIAMFKPVVRLNIFVDSVMNRKFKRTAFIWIIFCNNIKGFTVTFEYFNASLLSKSIHLLKNIWHQTFEFYSMLYKYIHLFFALTGPPKTSPVGASLSLIRWWVFFFFFCSCLKPARNRYHVPKTSFPVL